MDYYEKEAAAEATLKPLLTDEFLAALVLAAKTHGWSGDYTEVIWFVEWCFSIADKDCPDMSPLDFAPD